MVSKNLIDMEKTEIVEFFTGLLDVNQDGMSNGAAIGYAMLAMNRLNFDKETIRKVERCMYELMDEKTEQEAEKFYQGH